MRLAKGFTFSIDALLAVIVAMVGIAAVVAITSTGRTEATEMNPLQAAGQDLLTVMDKNGTFKAMFNQSDAQAANAVSASLGRLLPPQLVARLNITLCNYSGPGFSCSRNIVVQTNTTDMQFRSVARRVFADARNGKYGVAFLEVGYGGFGTGAQKYNGDSCTNSSQCYSANCGASYSNASKKYCCPSGSPYCCAGDADCGGNYSVCTTNSNCSGLTSITVSPGSVVLNLAGTQQFTATCYYSGIPGPCSPSWSSDSAIGSVNSSGFFTAGMDAANGTVNASAGSIAGTAYVTVNGSLALGANCTNSSQCASGYCHQSYDENKSYCCDANSTYCCAGDADCGGNYTVCTSSKNCTAISSVVVSPNPAVVKRSTSQQFTAACYSGATSVSCIPSTAWNASTGSINSSSGYFTAGSSLANGTVNATVGSVIGYAAVRVVYENSVACSSNSSCYSGYCGPNRVGNKDYCCETSPSMWCCTKDAECGGSYPTCGLSPDYNCR